MARVMAWKSRAGRGFKSLSDRELVVPFRVLKSGGGGGGNSLSVQPQKVISKSVSGSFSGYETEKSRCQLIGTFEG